MLTQTAKYALRALIYLTQQPDDNYHQTREVAKLIRVPANYLGKTLQKLARARIVDSQKGLHGGFRVAKLPEQVRLYDVLLAIDAIPGDVEGQAAEEAQQAELGALYERFAGVNRIYTKFLQETTLADLMHPESAAKPAADRIAPLLDGEKDTPVATAQ